MKKHTKKVTSVVLALAMFIPSMLSVSAVESPAREAIVLYTNDVHCSVDDYAEFAAYREQLEQNGYDVAVVDAGDAIQGEIIGSHTKGAAIAEIMNAAEYDFAVPGNHEFDYGTDTLIGIANGDNCYDYLSCNFIDLRTNKTVFEPYRIIELNGEKVAFLGIATPESYTKSTPAYFQDENGNLIYGFSQNDFYNTIQNSVDKAISEGATRVIAIGHLGVTGSTDGWKSTDVIANTDGIDVLLDAHTHEVIEKAVFKNKNGDDVLLSSTGSKFQYFGQLTLSANDEETELIDPDSIDLTAYTDEAKEEYREVRSIIDKHTKELDYLYEVIGESETELTLYHPETQEWIIRKSETNIGDFIADAYRTRSGADISLVNSGGIRDTLPSGDITRKDVMDVNPWNNEMCVIKATGQQILDALEHGARNYPDTCGGFLQVSGISYEIHSWIDSPVLLDDMGSFAEIPENAERRVANAKINGQQINPTKTYTVAGNYYLLKQGGDGFTMFLDCDIVKHNELPTDAQMLIDYITDTLNGKITAEQYGNALGKGRIAVLDEKPSESPETPADVAHEFVVSLVELITKMLIALFKSFL